MYNRIKKYLWTIVGGLIIGTNTQLFLRTAKLAPGGINGLAVTLNHLYNLPIWSLVILLNVPVFILGYLNYGKKYTLASLLGMFSIVFASFSLEKFSHHMVCNDTMLFAILSGTLMGFGSGIALFQNSSTGGTDILARVLKKKFRSLTIGKAALIINCCVMTFNGLVFRKFDLVLYSIISLFIQSKVVDVLNEGLNYSRLAFIISNKNEEIAEFILSELHRGVTGLSGRSMYTYQDKSILMSVIKKHQVGRLRTYISVIDPNAFVILSDSKEVLGLGFEKP